MNSIRPRTLTDYVKAARRRKLLIAGPALIVIIASFIAIRQIPNIYESSTFIIVESPQSDSANEHSPIDVSRRLATIRQQVTSRTRLEGLIDTHALYSDLKELGEPADRVIARMRSDVDVEVNSTRPEVTDGFTISYRSRDPQSAQAVTAALADQLIAENVQAMASQASGEISILQKRSSELSSQLHELEQRAPWLISLKEDSPPPAVGPVGRWAQPSLDALRSQQMTLGTLKDQQYKLQQQIADADRRIAEQRTIVDRQKKSGGARDNPTYGALVAKRAELQGIRDNYVKQQGLTDKHPRVIAVDDQIASINRTISDLARQDQGAGSQTAEERELRALESERNRYKIELEVVGREIDRHLANPPQTRTASVADAASTGVPRDAGSARMAQDYLGLKQNYKEVTARLQEAQLKLQTIGSANAEQFRVLDQANLPQLPVSPNRRLLFLIAAVAGLAIGACFGLAAELPRLPTLQDARDVEHYTKLPMLAAIPLTESPKEQRLHAWTQWLKVALGTAAAAAVTIGLAKVFILTNLFNLIGKK